MIKHHLNEIKRLFNVLKEIIQNSPEIITTKEEVIKQIDEQIKNAIIKDNEKTKNIDELIAKTKLTVKSIKDTINDWYYEVKR